jgi:hypothetical protein
MRSFITLYVSPNITRVTKSRRVRWAGHVASLVGMRNADTILIGKLSGRTTRRWKDIGIYLREVGWEVVG